MPAPTALLRRPEELAEAVSVPLPSESKRTLPMKCASSTMPDMTADQDDEFLLDAPEAVSLETNVIQPVAGEDSEMHIDEEGRPRFAPAKNIVRGLFDSFS
jgi:RNA-binding protein PNO1